MYGPLKVNYEEIYDESKKADEFNKYSISVAKELHDRILRTPNTFPLNQINNSLYLSSVSTAEISRLIGELKNTSYGRD